MTLNWETATEGDLGVKAQIYVNEVLQEDECNHSKNITERQKETGKQSLPVSFGLGYSIKIVNSS